MTPILHSLHHCESTCEHMTTFVKMRPDTQTRARQLQLLRDCADVCSFTAKYIARHSSYAKSAAALYATICEVCGNECLRFPDPESQNCGQICLACARECRAFSLAQ